MPRPVYASCDAFSAPGWPVACAFVAFPAAGPAAASTHTPVKVTVNRSSAGYVGSGFAGFSYEKDRVGAGMFDAQDTALVGLFRLLGHGYLRVSGNMVDRVNWNPSGVGGSASEIAPADVTKLAAFAKATGWRVIYGINLKMANSSGSSPGPGRCTPPPSPAAPESRPGRSGTTSSSTTRARRRSPRPSRCRPRPPRAAPTSSPRRPSRRKAITIAGSGVSADGTFTPTPKPVAVSGTQVTVSVPAGSAALVVTH